MKNSNTVFDDGGFTLAEALPAIAVVTLLLSLIFLFLSGAGTSASRSKESVIFLRDILEFDRTIREKAGEVIIPYWERTISAAGFSGEGRGAYGDVLEIPYYGGVRESVLRLSIDRESRMVIESGGGEGQEYYSAPETLLVKSIETLRDGAGRPLALKIDFEYRGGSFYTLAPFAAFPVRRAFYG